MPTAEEILLPIALAVPAKKALELVGLAVCVGMHRECESAQQKRQLEDWGVILGVRAQGVALRPYQPPNYPAKGGLACDPWGGLSCQLPRFQGQGASETHPSETSHAAQLPDCDLTGS